LAGSILFGHFQGPSFRALIQDPGIAIAIWVMVRTVQTSSEDILEVEYNTGWVEGLSIVCKLWRIAKLVGGVIVPVPRHMYSLHRSGHASSQEVDSFFEARPQLAPL